MLYFFLPVGGLYKYDFGWQLQNRNGIRFANISESTYDYTLQHVYYNFEKLFDDPAMSEYIFRFNILVWKHIICGLTIGSNKNFVYFYSIQWK